MVDGKEIVCLVWSELPVKVMSSPNLLFDLPFSLQLELFFEWLGGITGAQQEIVKSVLALDSAVCNKQTRFSLYAIYQTIDFEKFFFTLETERAVSRKMKWVLSRPIVLPKLILNCVQVDGETLKQFFRTYGAPLKGVRLVNLHGAMTQLTKIIATECKGLEVFELERCNLTLPIADILNKTTTIREVRLQKKVIQGKSVASKGNKHLFEKIECPSVVKLALLDKVQLEEVAAILKAFPNITDLELKDPSPDVLTALFKEWKNISVLHLVGFTDASPISPALLAPVSELCPHLTKIVLSSQQQDSSFLSFAFAEMLDSCTHLSAVCLETYFITHHGAALMQIAEHLNTRLVELQVGRMAVGANAVIALATHCPNLRVLNMHHLARHAQYVTVLQNCPIQKLRVALWATGPLKLQFFADVAEHCNHLQVFSLHSVYETLQEQPILQIVARCKTLKVVETPTCDSRAWRTRTRPDVVLKGKYERPVDFHLLKDYDF